MYKELSEQHRRIKDMNQSVTTQSGHVSQLGLSNQSLARKGRVAMIKNLRKNGEDSQTSFAKRANPNADLFVNVNLDKRLPSPKRQKTRYQL